VILQTVSEFKQYKMTRSNRKLEFKQHF